MTTPVVVAIIGAPIACREGVKDAWREAALWVDAQLSAKFGEGVKVHYYDLFDADCPVLPPDAQLPLVMVDGTVISSGAKLSVPLLRKEIAARGCGLSHEAASDSARAR